MPNIEHLNENTEVTLDSQKMTVMQLKEKMAELKPGERIVETQANCFETVSRMLG